MQSIPPYRWLFKVLVAMAALSLASSLWGQGTGAGQLNISTTDNFCQGQSGTVSTTNPNKFNVSAGAFVHLSIAPAFPICTTGVNNNQKCSSAADCSTSNGKCNGPQNSKTCSGGSPVNAGGACTTDAQCNIQGTCQLSLECQGDPSVIINTGGFTTYTGSLNGSQIDLCYQVNGCINGPVGYCPNGNGMARFHANASVPKGQVTQIPALVKVGEGGDCDQGPATCVNEVGSLCCGLTQGAYGAPNSVATCSGSGCNPITGGLGYIPAAAANSLDVFSGDPNATTIGLHLVSKSVTVDNLTTLIAYLPAGSTPGSFNGTVTSDTHYGTSGAIPDSNKQTGGSKGQGGGSLSGQAMGCSLNSFLSGTLAGVNNNNVVFTPSGFGNFVLPAQGVLLCTKRSGPDKVLGTGDDVCEAFSYPSCVAGLSVSAVLAKANSQLGIGSNANPTCTASELTNALNNINVQFDQCGNVIACGAVTTPGVFTCP